MDNATILWIFGIVQAILALAIPAGIAFAMSISNRVSRIETVISMLGESAARALHSPDDHLRIDTLLDKYLDRNYELSLQEWQELLHMMERIEADETKNPLERAMAGQLKAIASHKAFLPPPRRNH